MSKSFVRSLLKKHKGKVGGDFKRSQVRKASIEDMRSSVKALIEHNLNLLKDDDYKVKTKNGTSKAPKRLYSYDGDEVVIKVSYGMADIVLDADTGDRTLTFPKDDVAAILADLAKGVENGEFDEEIKTASKEIGQMRKKGNKQKRATLKTAA